MNISKYHCIIIFCLLIGAYPVFADSMSSDNYRIQSDSINIGGINQSSSSYRMEETIGEAGTGEMSSAFYKLKAGYQQMVDPTTLVLAIRNSAEDADTNICSLETFSTTVVSTCSYRLKIYSNDPIGFQVSVFADDQLNQSDPAIDIDDVIEDTQVAAGKEGHGIIVVPPTYAGGGTATAWTEQSPFNDDDTPVPVGASNIGVILKANGSQIVDMNGTGDFDGTTLITHRAAVSTATQAGSYDQIVTYTVSSIL